MKILSFLSGAVQGRIFFRLAAFLAVILLSFAPAIASAVETHDVGNLYALIVGVSSYRNATITQLKVSDKDAKDFARFLEGQSGLFKRVNVKLLTNEQATKAAVEESLHYWLRKSGKDDTVLLFFSGHGADDPYHPDKFYFVVHDSDPRNLQGTAINMSGLEFIRPLDSKRVVLIADTCHAGGYSMQGTKRVEPVFQRFLSQFKESQGRIIITSCQPNELSMEKPGLPNSVFTHYLLEGLAGKADSNGDGVVTLKEAYEYVYEKAKEATKGIQHPQFEGRFVGMFPLALAMLNNRPAETRRHEAVSNIPLPGRGYRDSYRNKAERVQTFFATSPRHEAEQEFRIVCKDPHAVEWIQRAAEQGDILCQAFVGHMFFLGIGASLDFKEAMRWYRKAAEQGNAWAQCNLGFSYEGGFGVTRNDTEAARWYEKSFQQNYAPARDLLGRLCHIVSDRYLYGHDGVPKNMTEAAKWYRKWAEVTNRRTSPREDVTWLRTLAQQENEDAKRALDQMGVPLH